MYLLRKYVRQAGAAPLPEPSQPPILQPVGPAICAGLRPLPEPSWRTAKTPSFPASWLAMSVGVLKHSGAGKIPMSETMGIERLGRFPAGCLGRRGGAWV